VHSIIRLFPNAVVDYILLRLFSFRAVTGRRKHKFFTFYEHIRNRWAASAFQRLSLRNAHSVFPNSFNKRRVPVNPWIWTFCEWSSVFKYKTTVRIGIDQQKCRKELFRIVKQSDKVHRFYYTGVLDIYCCKQFGKLSYRWKFSDDFSLFSDSRNFTHLQVFWRVSDKHALLFSKWRHIQSTWMLQRNVHPVARYVKQVWDPRIAHVSGYVLFTARFLQTR